MSQVYVNFVVSNQGRMVKKTNRKSKGNRSGSHRTGKSGAGGWLSGNAVLSVIFKILLVVSLLFLSRVLFFLFNYTYFSETGLFNVVKICFLGLRFDLSAALIINVPFILMMTLPFGFVYNKIYRGVASGYFYFINSLAFLTNFADTIYFRFTLKRMTADIFAYMGVGGDFDKLIPQFLKDFWFMVVIWLIFIFLLGFFGRKFSARNSSSMMDGPGFGPFALRTIFFIFCITASIIGIRGGFQLRPLSVVTAGNYVSGKYIPLILNTPFSIAKTFGGESLKIQSTFAGEKELASVYTPLHHGKKSGFKPMNVMILIMESFSREHIGSLNHYLQNGRYQGFTPFLDSLIRYGLYFDAYANGKTSIQGIPSILSGIPSLMNESFIQTGYASGKYTSIAGLLKKKGYTSAFFHGGTNGTMGFDSYTKLVGFEHYYGRSEYNNEKDYDGKWGILDEEFFQYIAKTLDVTKEPFVAATFSLSSHHPYYVPAKYINIFRKGHLPIQQSVMYADHSLREFFNTARKMKWYSNTLFIITADHTSEGYYPYYQSNVGQYAVPLLFFKPDSDLKGKSGFIAQQTDILPTVMDYLGYDHDYIAFGSELFDTAMSQPHFSVHYITGIYGMMKDGYYMEYNGTKVTSLYNLKEDLLQKNNLAGKFPEEERRLLTFLKAYIQQYNNRMIENRLMTE